MEHDQAITDREWCAYVAGFFDGEGTVVITRRRASRAQYSDNHQVWLGTAQRTFYVDVLQNIQSTFGGSVRALHRPNQSPISEWSVVRRSDQRRFIDAVLPFLHVKRAQALLALDFLTAVEAYGRTWRRTDNGARFMGTRPLTTEQIAERECFRQQMLLLNRAPSGT
jgi:hypothetical protein